MHCHLLFHLPVEYRTGKKLRQVEEAILRLVKRHGCGVWGDNAIEPPPLNSMDLQFLRRGRDRMDHHQEGRRRPGLPQNRNGRTRPAARIGRAASTFRRTAVVLQVPRHKSQVLGGVAAARREPLLQPPSVGKAGRLLDTVRVKIRPRHYREGEGQSLA